MQSVGQAWLVLELNCFAVLALLVWGGHVRYGTGTWPWRIGRTFRRLPPSPATANTHPDPDLPHGTGVILQRRRAGEASGSVSSGRATSSRPGRLGPGLEAQPARLARMACTAREFWTVAMTQSRRGQAGTSTANTRRMGAAHVQESGGEEVQIRLGYELIYECQQFTPMILTLNVHYTRASDLVRPDYLVTDPPVPVKMYRDGFGNWCSRIVAPPGRFRLTTDALINDHGEPEFVPRHTEQHAVESLPEDTLVYLLGSRYCDTDHLSTIAWDLFGKTGLGWQRVQAVCDFVHQRITFGYQYARPTKTAWEAFNERQGVCRDFAHLAIALCRCLNIPARYCTGYLGDIGVPPVDAPMDFAGWFEAYIGGNWYTFDPRNNQPRIGRVLIARGRDAADVAISTTFGPAVLSSFRVWTDEVLPV